MVLCISVCVSQFCVCVSICHGLRWQLTISHGCVCVCVCPSRPEVVVCNNNNINNNQSLFMSPLCMCVRECDGLRRWLTITSVCLCMCLASIMG